jgi:hypothetical protein
MQQPTSFLKGWLEIGMSNPNIFQTQSNSDIIFRTYDDNTSNKIIIGNTSSNNTPNCVGAMYILGNNVGLRKNPRSNIVLDVDGVISISSNVYIGTTTTLSTTTLTGDFVIANSNTSNMTLTNTSNAFKMNYGNTERLKITNGEGLYLNDNIYITNDVYASSYHMTSDKHLKHDIQQSTACNDLQTLLDLQVSDFRYLCDPMQHKHKGLIAQQVEEIFPQAVKEYEGIVPVYQNYAFVIENLYNAFLQIENPESMFSVGDKIVLGKNCASKEYIVPVVQVEKNHIVVETSHTRFPHEKVYIFGIMSNIKTIDPNQILALCISSIQELAKATLVK